MPDLYNKLQEIKQVYDKDGVAIIPQVFNQQEVNFMRAAAFMSLTKIDHSKAYSHKVLETKKIGEHEFPALIFWPCLINNYLDTIRKDIRLVTIAKEFLGDDVKQLNNQVYFRIPGDRDSFSWHQDVVFRKPKSRYLDIEEAYLQTIIVIDEIRFDNGAIEFVPGSHKLGDIRLLDDGLQNLRCFDRNRFSERFSGLKSEAYIAKPGDVLIWSLLVVHGSTANNSDRSRMVYMNGFAKADAALDWPDYLINGRVINVDQRLIP